MTGDVHVSQCAGFASSPSALSTDIVTVYWPLGAVCHWGVFLPCPLNDVPSQVNEKKPLGVALRVTYSSSLIRNHDLPVTASFASSRTLRERWSRCTRKYGMSPFCRVYVPPPGRLT